MKSFIIAFFIFFAFIKNIYAQLPTGKEPGKCYAKCAIKKKLDVETETFAEFLGDKMMPGIEEYSIQTEDNQAIWLENRITKDSTFYSYLNEYKRKFYIVSDTFLIKDFKMTTIIITTLLNEPDNLEWREVFCDSKVTPIWIKMLNQKLYDMGFDCNPNSSFFSKESKAALNIFQKYNNLPIGQLNIETMQKLGLKIK